MDSRTQRNIGNEKADEIAQESMQHINNAAEVSESTEDLEKFDRNTYMRKTI